MRRRWSQWVVAADAAGPVVRVLLRRVVDVAAVADHPLRFRLGLRSRFSQDGAPKLAWRD